MYREKFVSHDGIYLLNHSVGRPPVSARAQVLDRFFEPWESGDAEIWPIWIQQIEQFRIDLGRLLNAEAAGFCPQANLSSAVTKIIHSLPRRAEKSTIVCTEQDFPSIGFVLTQAQRAGYLWVDPGVVDQCEPIDVGWFSHADPFEFDINNFRYADGALRFWGGTPSVLPYVLASAGIQLICDIGVDRIRQHNAELTSMVLDALPSKLTMTPRDPAKRGGTLLLNLGESQTGVEENLTEAHVRFDSRNAGIRMSPHIYNTAEEMEVVLGCIL